MPRRRLGAALLLPPAVAGEVDGLRRALGDPTLGRIAPHLTLVPPLNVPAAAMEEALARLRAAADATVPFTLTLGPPTSFLPANPVLFLAVGGHGVDELHRLRDRVFQPPLERRLTWPFVPHVTLADGIAPHRIRAGLAALGRYAVDVPFHRVTLLEEGPGRVWTPVADAELGAAVVVGRGGGMEVELAVGPAVDEEARRVVDAEWEAFDRAQYGAAVAAEPFGVTARRQGRVVGAARGSLHPAVGAAHLSELIVVAAERGTGVGSRLLAAVESLAAGHGCTRLTVHTDPATPSAGFYRGRGFVDEVCLPRWRFGRDFVRMVRNLA